MICRCTCPLFYVAIADQGLCARSMPGDDGDEGVQPKISPVERARQAEQIQRKKEEAMRRRMQNQQNRP